MPEATPAAPAAPPAAPPATPAAPAPKTEPAATPASTPATPPATSPGPEQTQPPAPDPATELLERRAEALRKVKTESARIQAQQQKLAADRAAHAQELEDSAELRRLDVLKKSNPLEFLKEIGLSIPSLSKQYLEQQTGQGKTPQQLVDDAVNERMAKLQETQAAEKAKADEAAQIQAREAAYAGARRALGDMIKADPANYELCGLMGDEAVSRAFTLIEKYHSQTSQVLDFGKALATVEKDYETRQLTVFQKSKKVQTGLEKLRAEAVEAAKKLAEAEAAKAKGIKAAPKSEARASVETDETKSPQPKPSLSKRLMPRDQKRIAKELVLANLAKADS